MSRTLDDLRKQGFVITGPPLIQTAEDARIQYLRGVIDEDELKEILAWHGASVEPTSLVAHPNSFERVDDAFERSLPDVAEANRDKLEDKLARIDMKEKARQAALDAAPKPGDVKAENVVKVAVDPNQASKEAYEKVQEKELPKIEADKEKRKVSELKEDVKVAQAEVKEAQSSRTTK